MPKSSWIKNHAHAKLRLFNFVNNLTFCKFAFLRFLKFHHHLFLSLVSCNLSKPTIFKFWNHLSSTNFGQNLQFANMEQIQNTILHSVGQPYLPPLTLTCPLVPSLSPDQLGTLGRGASKPWAWPCRPHATCRATPPSLLLWPRPPCHTTPPHLPTTAYARHCHGRRRPSPEIARPKSPSMPLTSQRARHGHPPATRRLASSSTPWTPFEQVERHRTNTNPPDTLSTTTRDRRRRRRGRTTAADTARHRSNATKLGTARP